MARGMPSKRFAIIGLASCLIGGPACADDVPASIREVMKIESDFWSPKQPKQSIFSDDRIERLFSKDFVRLYRAAMKHPIYPDGKTPFDFDIIVQAQDSCTLDDMKIAQYEMDRAGNYFEVSFANFGCFDDNGDPKRRTTIYLSLVDEGGRQVIDDVMTYDAAADKENSTKMLMANIAAGEPEKLYQPR
jgi:hypothetical protein